MSFFLSFFRKPDVPQVTSHSQPPSNIKERQTSTVPAPTVDLVTLNLDKQININKKLYREVKDLHTRISRLCPSLISSSFDLCGLNPDSCKEPLPPAAQLARQCALTELLKKARRELEQKFQGLRLRMKNYSLLTSKGLPIPEFSDRFPRPTKDPHVKDIPARSVSSCGDDSLLSSSSISVMSTPSSCSRIIDDTPPSSFPPASPLPPLSDEAGET